MATLSPYAAAARQRWLDKKKKPAGAAKTATGLPSLELFGSVPSLPSIASSPESVPYAGGSPLMSSLPGMAPTRGGTVAKYGSMTEFNQAAQAAGPEMWRKSTPLTGAGAGVAGGVEGDVGAIIQQLRTDPSAWGRLSPEQAAFLEQLSEEDALGQEQEQAQKAIETIATGPTTGAAAPPDIEGTLSPPGYSQRYWASREREEVGEINRRFTAAKKGIEEQVARGANRAWADAETSKLEVQRQSAVAAKMSGIKDREEDVRTEMEQRYAAMLLQRYGIASPQQLQRDTTTAGIQRNWPTLSTAFTNAEEYMRGARMGDLAAMAGGGMAPVIGPGGGGGEGGNEAGFGPDAGGEILEFSHRFGSAGEARAAAQKSSASAQRAAANKSGAASWAIKTYGRPNVGAMDTKQLQDAVKKAPPSYKSLFAKALSSRKG